MAYSIELEEDYQESDVPMTIIRSKTDCPIAETATTLTTNDIVINKLTQILSYLRHGQKKDSKKRKRDVKEEEVKVIKEEERKRVADESIYGNIGEYVPKEKRSKSGRHREHREHRHREKKGSYFERSSREESDKYNRGWAPADIKREASFSRNTMGVASRPKKDDKMEVLRKKMERKMEIDSYAECYPGMVESFDAQGDSDEEADLTKMDMGNKRGPVNRWDFDTNEDYQDFVAHKEALPKAAFQYGVKMADGRKTRRVTHKDDKAAIDREWQKIKNIIDKKGPPAEKKKVD